ncbi:unnamed protein product [Musa textilis]
MKAIKGEKIQEREHHFLFPCLDQGERNKRVTQNSLSNIHIWRGKKIGFGKKMDIICNKAREIYHCTLSHFDQTRKFLCTLLFYSLLFTPSQHGFSPKTWMRDIALFEIYIFTSNTAL